MNIVELITSQFGSQIVGAVSNALGIGQEKTQSAISGSIPALLAGLVGLTSKPQGTQTFSNVMNQADPGFLDNLAGALQGGKQDSLIETGGKMLGSLFGDNKLVGLVSALAGSTGLQGGVMKSLIGLAAPAVLGLLKKEQKSRGLDLNGLVGMLQGQKQSISAALPQGLSSQLSSAGLLEGFSDTAAAARSAVAGTAQAATAGAKAGGSIFRWLIPLVILAVLLWLAWQYLFAPKPTPVATPGPEMTRPLAAAPSLVVGGVDLGEKLSGAIGGIGSALSGVKDAASAEAAVGALTAQGAALGEVAALVEKLPAAARQSLAGLIGPQFAKLESLAKQVIDLPGVGPVLTPVLMPILAQISALLNP
jgi:hypothetical protein